MFGLSIGVVVVVAIIYFLSTALFTMWLANQKGYSQEIWFLLGLFFGIIAFLAVGFAPAKKTGNTITAPFRATHNEENEIPFDYIVKYDVNLFPEPDFNSNVITCLAKGDEILLLEKGMNVTYQEITAPWFKVKSENNIIGWCFSGRLKRIEK